MPVEFLVLHDVDLVISYVENNTYIEETREDEADDMEGPDMGNMFCDAHLTHSCPASITSGKFIELTFS